MADSFLYPAHRLPTQSPTGAAPYLNVDTPVGAFGGVGAARLQQAGQNMEQAADNAQKIFLKASADVNEARADGLLNDFVNGKQKLLYTDPDAFYRQKGDAAVNSSESTTKRLTDLKERVLGAAGNDAQRDILRRRLDAHFIDATNGMSRHVVAEAANAGKQAREASLGLAAKDTALDPENDQNIKKNLVIAEDVALAQAKADGFAPDSDRAKMLVLGARSTVLKSAMDALIGDDKKRKALELYDRVKDDLAIKDDTKLHAAMKSVRTEIDSENAASGALTKVGLPGIRSGDQGGSRDNNIGNLRPPGANAGFQTFETFDDGVAATVKNLQAYPKAFNGGQPMNLQQIGARWAPKGDGANDPNQWAKNVGSVAGVDPTKPVDLSSPETAAKLARGIHQAEWGKARPVQDYQPGVDIAFGKPRAPFKGDLKAGYEQAKADLASRSDLSPEVRNNALALLSKAESNVTSYQTSALKALNDEANQFRVAMYLDPARVDITRLASFADRADALGDQTQATRYRLFAAIAPGLKNGLQSLPADQFKLLKSIEESLPKQLLEGIDAGKGDSAAAANDAFDKLKKKQENGLSFTVDEVKQVAQMAADAGKGEKAREVAEWGQGALAANQVLKLTPDQQAQAQQELRAIAAKGEATGQHVIMADELRKGIAHQQAAIARDGLSGGAGALGITVPPMNLDDPASVSTRVQLAGQVNASRPDAKAILATQPEVQGWRQVMEGGTPQSQEGLMRKIALQAPADMIPQIGAALAGVEGSATPVSRGYAAALSFFSRHDAEGHGIGREILDGVQRRKEMGDSARKPGMSSDAVQAAMQEKMGNAFIDMGRKVPAIVVDAAEAVYVSRMIKSGRQGEKIDTDVLNASLDAVVGKTITRNGQMLLPPKGIDVYAFDKAVHSLRPSDVEGFKTLNGSDVTADKIARYGRLTNAGGEGLYYVSMPDAAQNGAQAYVMRPDGRPYILDITTLLGREPTIPRPPSQTTVTPLMAPGDYSKRR